jgi:hypothetical protein
MRAWFVKVASGLAAADPGAEQLLRKMGEGEACVMSVFRLRSLQWHRLYYGACRAIGLNQDPIRDEDSIDYELRVLAGHFDVIYVAGLECRVPKRIAFNELSPERWAMLWPSIDQQMRERFGFDVEAWKRSEQRPED